MSSDTSRFKVATLNLFNYLAPPSAFYESENIYSAEQWKKKERWIGRQLTQWEPDIIGFQEVFSPDELKNLAARHGLPHFATVSEPGVREHYVYDKPVVALASKFPIVSIDSVRVSEEVLADLNLGQGFGFSRAPIKAEIAVRGVGQILVYVVHLKSQRSLLESALNSKEASLSDVAESLFTQVNGRWASTVQRGIEAVMIYQDMVKEMWRKERPVILLGDLNDTLHSHAIKPLLGGANMDKLNNRYISSLPKQQQRAIWRLSLHDAFWLQNVVEEKDRKPTHYFAGKGNVLDYILLSKDFDSDYDHSLASVEGFVVSDKHLINPDYAFDSDSSDHAFVMIDIQTRV